MNNEMTYEEQAVFRFAHRSIVKILNRTTQNVGSGVLIRIAHKYFIATAGHVLEDRNSIEIVTVSGKSPILQFRSFGIDRKNDVGFLELFQNDEDKLIDKQFAEADRIAYKFRIRKEFDVLVIGYPLDYHIEVQPTVVMCCANTFHSILLSRKDWPNFDEVQLERHINKKTDLFIEHDPLDGKLGFPPGEGNLDVIHCPNSKPPNPKGMSGGGIWSFSGKTSKSSGIWSPGCYLLGIQSSVFDDKKLMRGVRIIAWCKLVRKHYSDDKTIIEALDKISDNKYPPKGAKKERI